jgi:hypothetical protein
MLIIVDDDEWRACSPAVTREGEGTGAGRGGEGGGGGIWSASSMAVSCRGWEIMGAGCDEYLCFYNF